MQYKRKNFAKLIASLLSLIIAIFALLAIYSVQMPLNIIYKAEKLDAIAKNNQAEHFFQLQTDAGGHNYVWTQENSAVWFDYRSKSPVQITFELRSAAVAGGPAGTVQIRANGWTVGELRPNPQEINFESSTLNFSPPPALVNPRTGQLGLKVELLTTTFKPAKDGRNLGTMVKSISLDKSEAWDSFTKRKLLFFPPVSFSSVIFVF